MDNHCDANDPWFEHLADEQIVNSAKRVDLEESEGEEKELTMWLGMSHNAALLYVHGLLQ